MEEILAIKFTTDFTDCSFECIHIYCNKKKKKIHKQPQVSCKITWSIKSTITPGVLRRVIALLIYIYMYGHVCICDSSAIVSSHSTDLL